MRSRRILNTYMTPKYIASGNRQAVALNSFLEVMILLDFFIKKSSKIITSKDERSGAQQKRFGESF